MFLNMATAMVRQQPAIIPLQSGGSCTPIYAVPGHVGAPFTFSDLSKRLGGDQPFYALQPPGFDGQSEPMDRDRRYRRVLRPSDRRISANRPVHHRRLLLRRCNSFRTGKNPRQRGAEVPCIALFGPLHPATYKELPRLLYFFARRSADPHLREMAKLPTFSARLRYFGSRLRNLRRARSQKPGACRYGSGAGEQSSTRIHGDHGFSAVHSHSVFGSSMHFPSEQGVAAIGCSTAPMASSGAPC